MEQEFDDSRKALFRLGLAGLVRSTPPATLIIIIIIVVTINLTSWTFRETGGH